MAADRPRYDSVTCRGALRIPRDTPRAPRRTVCHSRRGESSYEALLDAAFGIGVPGQWVSIDLASVDVDPNKVSSRFPGIFRAYPITRSASPILLGLQLIGDDVKAACAQIVRNAQATPALNASRAKIDTMRIQYFSSSLVDETVQAWLRPYVANKLGER